MTTPEQPAGTPEQRERVARHAPVVVGVDGSAANASAVEFAADLAAGLASPLHLVAVVTGLGILPSAVTDHPDENGWEVLADIAQRVRTRLPELEIRSRILFGDPVGCLLEAAKEAQLVVVGKRGLGTFARVLLGSTSTGVAERASCPVVVVPRDWPTPGRSATAPVVVGLAASGPAERGLLTWAFEEAERTESPLDVVHAVDIEPVLIWDPGMAAAAFREWEEETTNRIDDEVDLIRAAHPDLTVRVVEERGHPANVLLDKAAGARLIVVGRHHRSVLGFGLSSTERGVLHYAEVPVAVVAPHA